MTAAELIAELQKLPAATPVDIKLRVNNSVDVIWRDRAARCEVSMDSSGQVVSATIVGASLP